MSIIRFSTDEVFNTDSVEYEILQNAAASIKGVPGAVVEIGTRRGGSAKLIIDTLQQNSDTNRPMFCIDPYGNIDYPYTNFAKQAHYPGAPLEGDPNSKEIVSQVKLDYDNSMRNRIIPSLYFYAYQAGLDFTFFCLEDTEFFFRYADGVPVYNEHKTLVNDYSLVFFDGPHDNDSVQVETLFFLDRTSAGAVLVYDDIWMYDHDSIDKLLLENGWNVLEKGRNKASYKKR